MQSGLGAGETIADRYEVGEVLGRGGMGEVRAGRDLRLQRDVAIKFLSPEVAARPRTRDRFDAEARSAARLSHPNIVLVYDSGDHEGVPFLVMERLPGRTLADELAHGPLPADRVRSLGADVLAALGAAHAAGIVHRDIKPGNVLLAPDGTVKVADFGIAKTVDGDDLTTTGMLLGTPGYLSPEQVAGRSAAPASDIYAVGVLLYEALTGVPPFTGASALAVARAVETAQARPVRELRPDAPADLVAVIERAMEKDPVRRYRSAEEMAAALTPSSVPFVDVDATERVPSTQRFGSTTRQGVQRALTGRLPALTGSRLQIVLFVGIFILAVVLALAVSGRDDTPGPGAGPPATTTSGAVPQDLAEALDRLDEAVRP